MHQAGLSAKTRLDWIDGLLVAFGFVLLIAVASALETGFGVKLGSTWLKTGVAIAVTGPVVLRRQIFGPPALPAPKPGVLWSVVSMIGLLALLFGVATLAFGGMGIVHLLAPAPDFSAKAAVEFDTDPPPMQITIEIPGESPEQANERKAKARADSIADLAKMDRESWEHNRKSTREATFGLTFGGFALIGFGALCLWTRYPRRRVPGPA